MSSRAKIRTPFLRRRPSVSPEVAKTLQPMVGAKSGGDEAAWRRPARRSPMTGARSVSALRSKEFDNAHSHHRPETSIGSLARPQAKRDRSKEQTRITANAARYQTEKPHPDRRELLAAADNGNLN